jgi:hypothetical protein
MARSTTWLTFLTNGRGCGHRPIAWQDWSAEIDCSCADFESPVPRRDRDQVRQHWQREYGKPPLVGQTSEGFTLGELAVVDAFRDAGWTAYWTDTFGSSPEWTRPWREVVGPEQRRAENVKRSLGRIISIAENHDIDPATSRKHAKPWDVVAWKGEALRIIEFKQAGESFTVAERKFAWGASLFGMDLSMFGVLEGHIAFPSPPTGPTDFPPPDA